MLGYWLALNSCFLFRCEIGRPNRSKLGRTFGAIARERCSTCLPLVSLWIRVVCWFILVRFADGLFKRRGARLIFIEVCSGMGYWQEGKEL